MSRVVALSILCIFLNCSAGAQMTNETADLMNPVHMIRTEKTMMYGSGGTHIEGGRIVSQVTTYDSKGRKTEQLNYTSEGLLALRSVRTYGQSNELIEESGYSADGSLVHRYIYTSDSTERRASQAIYNADGVLSAKGVDLLDEKGRVTESIDFEAGGSPQIKEIYSYDDRGRVSEVISCAHNPDVSIVSIIQNDNGKAVTIDRGKVVRDSVCGEGFLASRDIYAYKDQGITVERSSYASDRSLIKREVTTSDARGLATEVIVYNNDGTVRSRVAYDREYDSRGNWIKEMKSEWNTKTASFEPKETTYRTITYY